MTTAKRSIAVALAGAALTVWGTAGAADRAKGADTGQPNATRATQSEATAARDTVPHPGGLIEVNWLIGAKLHEPDGSDLGKIRHVWVDPKSGQVKEVIVSVGEKMGLGGKDKVIAWQDLKVAWKDQKLFVTADPKALRDAYQAKMDRDDRGAASPSTTDQKR